MQHKLSLLAATSLFALGCNSVDSDGVFTSALYARVSADANGDGETTVWTTLYLENPSSLNFIELEGDDELTAYGPAGELRRMRESQFLGQTSYSATFEGEDAGSEFIVELRRTVDDSAPDSRVVLPAPFDVLTTEGVSLSRAEDDVVIDWSPTAPDDIDYTVAGTCITSFSGTLEGDPGSLTISANDILLASSDGVSDSCEVTVSINRARPGSIDSAYGHGGDAMAYQRRSYSFTTVP